MVSSIARLTIALPNTPPPRKNLLVLEMVPIIVADQTTHRMDEFVYQAVVDPKFLSKDVRNVLNKQPIVLPLWDPMGALA
jgi:hypothetical protein